VTVANRGGSGDPKARFLALHVATAVAQHACAVFHALRRDQWVALRLLNTSEGRADQETENLSPRPVERPALFDISDIQAERRRCYPPTAADLLTRTRRSAASVLKRMRRVGIQRACRRLYRAS